MAPHAGTACAHIALICSPRSAASRMMLHTRRMSSEDTEAGGQREHLLGQALGVPGAGAGGSVR